MEQYFRIALWMFVLIGSLQANPVCSSSQETLPSFDVTDMGLGSPVGYLETEVTCEPNVTLIAPRNVQENCHTAALELFIEGVKQAKENCTDDNGLLSILLADLRTEYPKNTICSHPKQCAWEIQEYGQQYAGFLKALKKFLKKLNN